MAGSRRLTELSDRVLSVVRVGLGVDLEPLVVALSGGADSGVLAWALGQLDHRVRAIHVHHGWPASDRMADAAEAVAARLALKLSTVAVDTSGHGSPEAVARDARYGAFERGRADDELVATGHTLTDQAETLVGNLMWGSGIDGLRGIRRRSDWLIRPMLGLGRHDIREVAELLGLPYVDDPANEDVRYRRTRIRRALAAWEADLAPGMAHRLALTADLVADDINILERLTADVTIESALDGVRIATGALRSLEPGLARRVVRRALRVVNTGSPGSQTDVEAILAVASGGPPTEVGGGHRVERSGAHVHIGTSPTSAHPDTFSWRMPGVVHRSGWSWRAQAFEGTPSVLPMSRWMQVFDASLFDLDSAVVRPLRSDDRIAMRRGHKTGRDTLAEAQVPSTDRDIWPALIAGDEVVWVPGARRADVGWVSDDTGRYLVISAEREARWKPVES